MSWVYTTQEIIPYDNEVLKTKRRNRSYRVSRSTIYKFMDEEVFPKTIPLGGRAVAWLESEIEE